MNADFVAVFEASRAADNHIGRLVRSEIEDMAPSKAHLKRLATRGRDDFRDPPKIREISQIRTAEQTARMMAFHKKGLATLGGSRTVAPTHDGTLYNAAARGLNAHVAPPSREELCKPRETDPTFRERKRLYLATKTELGKMVYTEHQPSLLDVIEFGE